MVNIGLRLFFYEKIVFIVFDGSVSHALVRLVAVFRKGGKKLFEIKRNGNWVMMVFIETNEWVKMIMDDVRV